MNGGITNRAGKIRKVAITRFSNIAPFSLLIHVLHDMARGRPVRKEARVSAYA